MLYFVSPKRSAMHSAIFWTLSFMFTFIFTVDLDCSVRITLASIWTFVDQTMSLSSGCNSSTDSSPSTMQDQRPSSTLCFTYTTLFSTSNMRAWPEMIMSPFPSSSELCYEFSSSSASTTKEDLSAFLCLIIDSFGLPS